MSKNSTVKKILLIGVILFLIALDWAALDDITTGQEPNYAGEYAILIISVIIFVFLGILKIRSKRLT